MDQSLNNKNTLKEKLILLLKNNRIKVIVLILIIFILIGTNYIIKISNKKENILLSEKFIKSNILLTEGKKELAADYFEDIILSGNKFYSLLALNTVIEKKLIKDNKKIIKYFDLLENNKFSEEITDLILLKKALFLMKIENKEEGEKILNILVTKDSKIKSIAQEIISK